MIFTMAIWRGLPAIILALAVGLALLADAAGQTGPLYPQQADTTDLDLQEEPPGPELSPSINQLLFDELLPGESRALFMDLANLGEGVIILDSLTFPEGIVRVALPLQTLRPGQFVRFPVTYTQADLDTHDLKVVIHWNSPKFNVAETFTLTLIATPRQPLIAEPSHVIWHRSYVGSENTARIVLQNAGTRPITFPSPPEVPAGVRLSPLPQILVGETSVSLTVAWSPAAAGPFSSRISLPYQMGQVDGVIKVVLQGEALQLAYFIEDTLTFGSVCAGSSYHRRVAVSNGSGHTIVLSRRRVGSGKEEFTAREERKSPAEWIETPPVLEVAHGEIAYLDVVFSPRGAGSYLSEIPFSQHLTLDQSRETERLPDLVLTIKAEVVLPLSATTGHVDFGPQPVLETAMRPLEVVNRGSVPLSISPELAERETAFSLPPLVFNLGASERLDIPLYFRPTDMHDYYDTAVLRFATISAGPRQAFGGPWELRLRLSGSGLDRPLLRLDSIPDITLEEDFPSRYPVTDLTSIFADANHQVSYRISHTFAQNVKLTVEDDGQLKATSRPDYHGTSEVVVQAVNELGHMVADTFRLAITPVNDLPRLTASLPDLVLREDPAPSVIGWLSEIFIDPDRALDTVVTQYTVYSPANDDTVRLVKKGDELVLVVTPDWYGSRSFVVSARDASDTSVVVFDVFKVTVLAVNDPPTLAPLPGLYLVEDDTAHVDWRPYVHDVDNSHEELTLGFTRAGGGALPLTFEGEGLTTVVRPKANWFGELVGRLTVTDQAGAAASGDFAVTVIPENDPPGPFQGIGPTNQEWEERLRYAGADTLITFEWTPSPNLDPGDALVYTWQLMDTSGQRVLKELPAGPSTSVTAHLDTAGIFLWSVVARDSEGAMAASDTLPLMLESTSSATSVSEGELAFAFGPNYPNPFSDFTRIAYTIPRYSDVVITVYDAMGRKVKVLRAEPHYQGSYVTQWDGRDHQGQRVASGPYVAEIRAGINSAYLKLVVVH